MFDLTTTMRKRRYLYIKRSSCGRELRRRECHNNAVCGELP